MIHNIFNVITVFKFNMVKIKEGKYIVCNNKGINGRILYVVCCGMKARPVACLTSLTASISDPNMFVEMQYKEVSVSYEALEGSAEFKFDPEKHKSKKSVNLSDFKFKNEDGEDMKVDIAEDREVLKLCESDEEYTINAEIGTGSKLGQCGETRYTSTDDTCTIYVKSPFVTPRVWYMESLRVLQRYLRHIVDLIFKSDEVDNDRGITFTHKLPIPEKPAGFKTDLTPLIYRITVTQIPDGLMDPLSGLIQSALLQDDRIAMAMVRNGVENDLSLGLEVAIKNSYMTNKEKAEDILRDSLTKFVDEIVTLMKVKD